MFSKKHSVNRTKNLGQSKIIQLCFFRTSFYTIRHVIQGKFMKFKDFVEKYKMTEKRFCAGTGLCHTTYWSQLAEKNRPSQRTAEKIEKFTKNLVTVKELRGCDDREEFNP